MTSSRFCRIAVKSFAGLVLLQGCGHGNPPPASPRATGSKTAAARAPAEPAAAVPDSAPAERVTTAAYSYPLPVGFTEVHLAAFQQVWSAGGSVIAEKARSSPDSFLGSVVVTPVASPGSYDPTDPKLCAETAEALGQGGKLVNRGAKIIPTPWGSSCRYVMQEAKNPNRLAVATIAYSPSSMWVITCNIDARDDPAAATCKAVVAGFTFSP